MNYRKDKRTKDEFEQAIKECTAREKVLMQQYVDWLNTQNKGEYKWIDTGCGNDGKLIEDDKKVTTDPDYVLYKDGKYKGKIEIKHCRPARSEFHLKINHIEKCIKNDVCIINWMGVDTEEPKFCILTPQMLAKALSTGKQVLFWQKWCIKFICKDYEWITPKV